MGNLQVLVMTKIETTKSILNVCFRVFVMCDNIFQWESAKQIRGLKWNFVHTRPGAIVLNGQFLLAPAETCCHCRDQIYLCKVM